MFRLAVKCGSNKTGKDSISVSYTAVGRHIY